MPSQAGTTLSGTDEGDPGLSWTNVDNITADDGSAAVCDLTVSGIAVSRRGGQRFAGARRIFKALLAGGVRGRS